MKRHKSLQSLSSDHHKGLLLARLLQLNAPAYKELPNTIDGKAAYAVNAFQNELLPHFHAEENAFNQLIKGRDIAIDKLLQRMCDEHVQLKTLFEQIATTQNLAEHLDQIGKLLEQHIRMEERQLFELIQEKCDEVTLVKMSQLMHE